MEATIAAQNDRSVKEGDNKINVEAAGSLDVVAAYLLICSLIIDLIMHIKVHSRTCKHLCLGPWVPFLVFIS